jgi:PAS domain S-box-containing protein
MDRGPSFSSERGARLPSPVRSAATAALVYTLAGVVWIVFSDHLLAVLAPSQEAFVRLQTWKGVGFVAVTAGILFVVLQFQFRRRAEAARQIRVAAQRLQLLVHNTPVAVVEWDSESRVTGWSDVAEDLLGWSAEEVMGKALGEWPLVHPDDQAEVDRLVEENRRRGAKGFFSLNRNLRPDGSVIWCEWYNSWILDSDGEIVSMLSLAHDVTAERRALEEVQALNRELERRVRHRTAELAQANAELKALSYSVSHDLRAPVRAILGFGGILERRFQDHLPVLGREYLGHMLEAGQQADRLIDGLLEYGRVGSEPMEPSVVDPLPVVRSVWARLKASGSVQDARLEVADSLPSILANEDLLTRIFQNLFSNSLKYGWSEAPPRIRVEGEVGGAGWANLRVRDDGPGIDEADRERAFDLFQRLHQPAQVAGAGVGLAVVKRSMERMGGRVHLEAGDPTDAPAPGLCVVLSFRRGVDSIRPSGAVEAVTPITSGTGAAGHEVL